MHVLVRLFQQLETLKQYVLQGTDEAGTECPMYVRTVSALTANAKTTEELQLEYYQDLCEHTSVSGPRG